jgi:TetR/AcrR family transcriptional regulator, transcriptional repressor for nem operon
MSNVLAQGAARAHLTAKGHATKARITAVAARLVFERGVASTSVEDVCREARVSASQIYHYYGDRNGLIRAVVQHQAQHAVASADPLQSNLDSVPALRSWAKFQVELQVERHCVGGCMLGSLISQVGEIDPDTRPELAGGFSQWAAVIASGLQSMKDRGELDDDAIPADLATALVAALEGGLLLTQVQRSVRPLDVALSTVIDRIESLSRPDRASA